MDNQSPNGNMRRRTDEQERRTKAQIRPTKNVDMKSKRGKQLECDRCGRFFLNEETLKYHTVMCNKTRILGKGERRTVKDFFPSDDEDNSVNLLFFTEKNMELTSKKDIIASVEQELGVSVTEFTGKEKTSDSEPQRRRRRRKRTTPIRTNAKKQAVFSPKKDKNQVKCDCCIQGGKEWGPISKGNMSGTCKATSSASASPCTSSSSSCSSSSSSSSSSSGEEDICETKKDNLSIDVKNPNLQGTTYFKDNYYILPFHENMYKSIVSPATQ